MVATMIFFLLAALLTLAVCVLLVRPLLRPAPRLEGPASYNAAIYRDQLAELDAETDRAPGPVHAASARLEIERRLLAAANSAAVPGGAAHRPAQRAALALFAIGPIAAGALYLYLGAPEAAQGGTRGGALGAELDGGASQSEAAALGDDPMHPEMNEMVQSLRSRLAANPQDAQGWALLARTQVRLGRTDEAVEAYRRAHDLAGGDDRQLAAEYAEARVMAAGGMVDAIAKGLFEALLRAEAGDPQARYYLALARGQAGDLAGALADWRALLADTPSDAPWRATLERQIAAAEAAASDAPAPARGPTPEQAAAGAAMAPDERAAMIEGMVAGLAERLRSTPRDVDGWRRLAQAYDVLGRTADAEQAHRRVLGLDPRDPGALWRLGQIAAAKGDASAARRHWRKLEQSLALGSQERARVGEALAQLPR
jgi:cytochrome c-type biogenesis protein CcmH